jgi:uncharacterized membrane protein YeiB
MFDTARTPLASRGPTPERERALAPDLARGVMLALIAVANATLYLHGRPAGVRGHPRDGSQLDRAWILLQMTVVDGRAYPMFAALFGYGMVQLANRQLAFGAAPEGVRRLLRRRGLWLVGFGLVHVALLFSGDILGPYGLLAILVTPLLVASARVLLGIVATALVMMTAMGAFVGFAPPGGERIVAPSLAEPDPLVATGLRLSEYATSFVPQLVLLIAPALLGVWAARHRLLEEPGRHQAFLRRVSVVGLGAAFAGGLPLALAAAWVWPASGLGLAAAGALHTATGVAGGLGYAALVGLVANRLGTRRGPIVTALVACGHRSLTCYLAQSVVFVTLFAPYAGGLGARLGSAQVAGVALLTWAATVVGADLSRRAGRRGPAEALLRRLTYGPGALPGRRPM